MASARPSGRPSGSCMRYAGRTFDQSSIRAWERVRTGHVHWAVQGWVLLRCRFDVSVRGSVPGWLIWVSARVDDKLLQRSLRGGTLRHSDESNFRQLQRRMYMCQGLLLRRGEHRFGRGCVPHGLFLCWRCKRARRVRSRFVWRDDGHVGTGVHRPLRTGPVRKQLGPDFKCM
jgi:hypothetical protein